MDEVYEPEEVNFSFELGVSDDGLTISLVCKADAIMSPGDYIQALDVFMEQLMRDEDNPLTEKKSNLQ